MDKLLEFIKDEDTFVNPLTLIGGIVAILIIETGLDGFVKEFITTGHKRRLFLYLFFEALFIAVWYYKRYVFPRVPKNKMGLVIAVTTETAKSRMRLKVDLFEKLKETIGKSPLQPLVSVILLNNHQAGRLSRILDAQMQNLIATRSHGLPVDPKSEKAWERVQKRMGARGFIFGKIKERMAGENIYILESHAFVTMPRVDMDVQKGIDDAFGRIWTSRIHIEEKAEFIGFPLSADLMFIPVAYIMGIAALISRDVFTALKFHGSLLGQTEQLMGVPEVAEVRRKLISSLTEENVLAGRYYLNIEPNEAKMRDHLDKALELDPANHMALIFKSIVDFSIDGNPEGALATIRRAKTNAGRDGTWRYNEGFLLLYLEQFDEGLPLYRAIARTKYATEEITLEEVIRFNEAMLEREPKKIQSLFILGFLTFKKDDNLPLALYYLEQFLKKARNQQKYISLMREAGKCVRQIRRQMK